MVVHEHKERTEPGVQDLIKFLLDAQSSSVMSAKGMERVK